MTEKWLYKPPRTARKAIELSHRTTRPHVSKMVRLAWGKTWLYAPASHHRSFTANSCFIPASLCVKSCLSLPSKQQSKGWARHFDWSRCSGSQYAYPMARSDEIPGTSFYSHSYLTQTVSLGGCWTTQRFLLVPFVGGSWYPTRRLSFRCLHLPV